MDNKIFAVGQRDENGDLQTIFSIWQSPEDAQKEVARLKDFYHTDFFTQEIELNQSSNEPIFI